MESFVRKIVDRALDERLVHQDPEFGRIIEVAAEIREDTGYPATEQQVCLRLNCSVRTLQRKLGGQRWDDVRMMSPPQ
jgi:hypothetical protein